MLTFTVHEPPDPPADRIDRAEKLVFIKDGFSWIAAVFGPLWMIFHRLWWALLGFLLVLAWKTAGYIGLDRFLMPLLGTPWKAPKVDTKVATRIPAIA